MLAHPFEVFRGNAKTPSWLSLIATGCLGSWNLGTLDDVSHSMIRAPEVDVSYCGQAGFDVILLDCDGVVGSAGHEDDSGINGSLARP